VPSDHGRAVLPHCDHGPAVTVTHPGPASTEPPIVAARDDRVTDSRTGSIKKSYFTEGVDTILENQFRPRAHVQRRHRLVGVADQNRSFASLSVCTPSLVCGLRHRLSAAFTNAIVRDVKVDGFGVSLPQPEGCRFSPILG
jgi:hypothetical protein